MRRLAGFTQMDVSDDYIHFITLANRSTVPLFDATKQMAKSRVKADGTFDVLNPFLAQQAYQDFSPLDLVVVYFSASLSTFSSKNYLTFNLYTAARLASAP